MMYNIDKLTLISGVDIPIPEIQYSIHQPTIREIAYVGEKNFYMAAGVVTQTKEDALRRTENLSEEDKTVLSKTSNFELFLKLTSEKPEFRIGATMLLSLLFPAFSVQIEERFLFLVNPETKKTITIDENNFDILQDIISTILCLRSGKAKEEFNPMGDKAREIAEKIKRGREKTARLKGETVKESSYLSKYISGLGIATNSLDMSKILNLTLYQFFNQIERFGLYTQYDIGIKAKLAGASDVEDTDWLADID